MKKVALRTVDQNSLMWQRLTDWMEQKPNRTLGGELFTLHDYKEWLMAGFKKDVRLAHGIEGGMVYLSRSTSGLTKDQFTQFLEYIAARGTERGIVFRDTPPDPIDHRRELHKIAMGPMKQSAPKLNKTAAEPHIVVEFYDIGKADKRTNKPPNTTESYISYARANIDAGATEDWFLSQKQASLRQDCKVGTLATNLLHSLIRERKAKCADSERA